MLKEIHEQADAVAETIADRTARGDGVDLAEEGALDESILADVERIVIVACGTSYHAGLIGRYAIESGRACRSRWTSPPSTATATRSRAGRPGDRDHAVGRDRRHARRDAPRARARRAGAGVTNVMGSQATRDSDGVLFTRAGLEIGVAATKTFLCQVAVMYLLGAAPRRAARRRSSRAPDRAGHELKRLPHCIDEVLEAVEQQVDADRRPLLAAASSSSTSAATSACPWRSRARSSSRRSPTSPPTPTPPAR
jgi:glucosamine--fructose-6-phosphate aminotransferase (isomerizing)